MVLTLILLAATITQPIYQNVMLRAGSAASRFPETLRLLPL